MRTHDLVVIGTGFGGLAAAALAARSGLDVAVFERHTRPGGCAGDFALGGFWFPAGATVVTGLERGGILRQVFDKLAINIAAEELNPSIVFRVEGHTLSYHGSTHAWKREMAGVFPGAAAYEPFWDWTHEYGGIVYRIGQALPSLPIQRWADVRRTARAFSPEVLKSLPLLLRTVGDVKRRLGAVGEPGIDSLLMDATGAPASQCSAIQGAIALDLFRRGCQWVEGGTARLAMALVRSIRTNGGTVDFGHEIGALRRSGGLWHVKTADREWISARRVVANVPPAALDRLRRLRPVLPREHDDWGAFVLHLGINATGLAPLGPYHQVIGGEAHAGSSFVSIFPSKARPDRWSISVSRHVRPSGWRGSEAVISRRRCEFEDELVCDVEQLIPGVRERILLQRSATPATFERYTARPGGFVGGIVQRPAVVALRAPGHRPERKLFLAGDHVFPGQGTVGTALSGINAYRDVAELLGREPLL